MVTGVCCHHSNSHGYSLAFLGCHSVIEKVNVCRVRYVCLKVAGRGRGEGHVFVDSDFD